MKGPSPWGIKKFVTEKDDIDLYLSWSEILIFIKFWWSYIDNALKDFISFYDWRAKLALC